MVLTPDIMDKGFISLDVEPSGFDYLSDRLIRITAVKVLNWKAVERYHTFLNPGVTLTDEIQELTYITNSDLSKGIQFAEAYPELLSFIDELPVFAHNWAFLWPFFKSECEKAGISNKVTVFEFIDLAKEVMQDAMPKGPTIKAIAALHNIECSKEPFDDADVIAKVLIKMHDYDVNKNFSESLNRKQNSLKQI